MRHLPPNPIADPTQSLCTQTHHHASNQLPAPQYSTLHPKLTNLHPTSYQHPNIQLCTQSWQTCIQPATSTPIFNSAPKADKPASNQLPAPQYSTLHPKLTNLHPTSYQHPNIQLCTQSWQTCIQPATSTPIFNSAPKADKPASNQLPAPQYSTLHPKLTNLHPTSYQHPNIQLCTQSWQTCIQPATWTPTCHRASTLCPALVESVSSEVCLGQVS